VVDFHARGDFAQAMPTRREESAEQAAALELLEPALPALGARAESLEDSRHLGWDHGLAVAEEAAGVIDPLIKFLQPNFDPFFPVERSFGEQECAADATSDAVIPARCGVVDELWADHRHG
jgi:hypothetical protein